MIALCMNTPGMGEGEWMDKDYGKRFPGAGWMPHLASTEGVWSGETILAEIKKGKLDPKDVVVVQEERNGKLKTLGEVLDNLTTDDGVEQ